MSTNFPTSVDSYSVKVDNVTNVMAAHVNDLQDAMVAVETYLLGSVTDQRERINHIINGDLRIWQRGTSFASVANADYTADRFRYNKSGAMVHTVSRSTTIPIVADTDILCPYSLLIDCTTADTSIAAGDHCSIETRIEGYNWLYLAQRQFTLSFWVRATKTGTYCVGFRNSGSDRSYVAEYSVSASDTWQFKTITVSASPSAGTWDYTTGVGLSIIWTLAGGSTYQTTASSWATGNFFATSNQVNGCDSTSNDFRLALIKIEPGGVATPFIITDFQQELDKCKRYYFEVGEVTGSRFLGGRADGSTVALVGFDPPVEMRTTPTIVLVNGSGNVRVNDGAVNVNITSIGTNFSSPLNVAFNANTDSGLTSTRYVFVDFTHATSKLTFDAEL